MDPATAAGLALQVYKDVFKLARSIYRLAVSTQHYKPEQRELIGEFYTELLYLYAFHNVFFVTRQGRLIGNRSLDKALAIEIYDIFVKIQRLFSDYKGLALEEDAKYRAEYPQLHSQDNGSSDDFTLALDDLLPPDRLPILDSDSGSKASALSLSELKKHFKEQPIYHLDAWKWSLFQKRKVTHLVSKFHKYNKRLKDLVPLFLSSQHPSAQDLNDFEQEITTETSGDYTAFLQHIRIRQVAADSSTEPDCTQNVTRVRTPIPLELGQSITSTRTWTEYKYYVVSDEDNNSTVSLSTVPSEEQRLTPLFTKTQRSGTKKQVHQLAHLLFEAGSYDLRTLPFSGYQHEPLQSRFAFYFEYPPKAASIDPVSLNELVQTLPASGRLPLAARFNIALILSKALGAFHADGWVHKSIMSAGVLFFQDNNGNTTYAEPYLTGFEFSRRESDETYNTFDTDPQKNLYRHPDRQGPPTAAFNRVHDIYALGVVLLEIGVWSTASAIQKSILGSMQKRYGRDVILDPETLRKGFIEYAQARLRHAMGDSYTEAVVTCLSDQMAPNLGQADFGYQFRKMVTEKVDAKRILE